MKLLGIDYGRSKVGFALAQGSLAEPLKVIQVNSLEDAVQKVSSAFAEASADKKVEKVIVGISEGEMAEETKRFVSALRIKLTVPIETFDETLTTLDAQNMSREGGISRKKRKAMEDAYAATIMLQNYLDIRK